MIIAGDFNINLLSKIPNNGKILQNPKTSRSQQVKKLARSGTKLNDHISLKVTTQNVLPFDEISNLNTTLCRC